MASVEMSRDRKYPATRYVNARIRRCKLARILSPPFPPAVRKAAAFQKNAWLSTFCEVQSDT
jgi:hypothetical protein